MKKYIAPMIWPDVSFALEDVLTVSQPIGFEVKDVGDFVDEMDF